MSRILSKLAAKLAGVEKSRIAAFTRTVEQLRACPEGPDVVPILVTLGQDNWEYSVLELGFPGGLIPMTELPVKLLAVLPPAAEITFVTHTLPVSQEYVVATADNAIEERFSHLLAPAPGQASNCIRSYLLVRTPQGASSSPDWPGDAWEALIHAYTPSRVLPGAEAAALLQTWCGAQADAEPSNVWICMVARPGPGCRHPLQTLSFGSAATSETWEAVSFRVAQAGEGFTHLASSVVLKECDATLRNASSDLVEAYVHRGYSVGEMHRGQASEPITSAMAWLQPVKQLSRRHKECLLLKEDVARQLPLPLSHPDTLPSEMQPFSLAAYDNLGAAMHLRSQHPYRRTHTLVMGYAGSGLTYLGNAFLAAHLRGGGHAWALRWQPAPIFDEVANAQVVNPTPDCQISLNPLSGLATAEQLWHVRPVLLSWLAMLAEVSHGAEAADTRNTWYRHWLETALEKAWGQVRENLGLEHVLIELECLSPPAHELSERIRAKLKNLPAAWFEGASSTQSAARYVSVSPAELNTPERETVAATVLALHYCAIVKTPRSVPKMLLIDEAGVLARDGVQELLSLVLRALLAENALAIICEKPFLAHKQNQSPLERVLDEQCENKVLTSNMHHHCWRDRFVSMLGYAPGTPSSVAGRCAYLMWVQEQNRTAALLKLELGREAQVAFSANPWQGFAYKESRSQRTPVMAALAHAATAVSPYAKGNQTSQ